MQEGFDLREQARWKLERAVEAAIAAKRWDAAGVAAFALAEVLGGDDSPAAVGALMMHQVCQPKPKLQTHFVFEASGKAVLVLVEMAGPRSDFELCFVCCAESLVRDFCKRGRHSPSSKATVTLPKHV